MNYYQKVKELCQAEEISIFNLERKLEIGNGTIGRWEKGATPSIPTLKKIAEYFNVPLSYFME